MPSYRKPKAAKACKQIFKNLTFVLTGEFNIAKGEVHKTHENITRWIECHGGTVQSEVNEDVSYLVASSRDFKNKVAAVKAAIKLKIPIVTYDFVEDSILGKKGAKLLKPDPFLHEKTLARVVKARKAALRLKGTYAKERKVTEDLVDMIEEEEEKHEEEEEEEEEEGIFKPLVMEYFRVNDVVDTQLTSLEDKWRIYFDSNGFEFKIHLTRVDLTNLTKNEKYVVYLFESISLPRYYTMAARLIQNGKVTGSYKPLNFTLPTSLPPISRPWPTTNTDGSGTFAEAFSKFKAFFYSKTGIAWDKRCDKLTPAQAAQNRKNLKFVYVPPKDGKPVGDLPIFWRSPEEKEKEAREVERRTEERRGREEEANPGGVEWVGERVGREEEAREERRRVEEKRRIEEWKNSYEG